MNHNLTEFLYLEPFLDQTRKLKFSGAYVWSYAHRHLLLSGSGHIILLNDRLFESLSDRKPEEELCIKLLQRGFLSFIGQEGTDPQPEDPIRPTFFMIDLTNRCNMSCIYCLRDGDTARKIRIISEETLRKVCAYIAENCKHSRIDHIMVQPWGGEPLLEKQKIWIIQDELARRGIHAQLTIETNGLLLDERTVQELYDRQISVSVSIDGFQSLHDRQRVLTGGVATHKHVENAVRRLQHVYGDNVSIIATVTRHSLPCLEQMLDYFAKDLCLKNIKINYVHKSSFQENDELCLNAEEISQCAVRIFDRIIALQEEGVCISEYNLWIRIMNLLTGKKLDICSSRGCSGGKRMITFDVNGNIFPCDVTDYPEEQMGNIETHPDLPDLIRKAVPQLGYFKEKTASECSVCPWHVYCRGGCTVHTKCAGGLPGQIDHIECSVNRTLYPRIAEQILKRPDIINRLADSHILDAQQPYGL